MSSRDPGPGLVFSLGRGYYFLHRLGGHVLGTVSDDEHHLQPGTHNLGDELQGLIVGIVQVIQAKADKLLMSEHSQHVEKRVQQSIGLCRAANSEKIS